MTPATAAPLIRDIVDEVSKAVVGKRAVLELILAGLIADGHVLLDDVPGVAKTLTARSLAHVAGLSYSRVQFTPDVLPADITGSTVLDLTTREAHFREGPIFASLVLADEINRAPAKTQAALLEAMQERQTTADGVAHLLPSPFLVIATQNPIESEGTYPLPEAQLDRFILRTTIGLPERADELEIIRRRLARGTDEVDLTPVTDAATFLAIQRSLERVQVAEVIGSYVVDLVRATRSSAQLSVGASPRGTLAVLKLSRALAVIAGRDFVTPDDVRNVALPALAHRVVLTADAWARGTDPRDVITAALSSVPSPSWQ
ncbi:MAG: MoxR family ATPase [Acidimicrobiaceae bacterium]|nr:MoxR family ATPase [Ilumatobacter sp.]MCB9379860.1 MoxR family ATPase [Acidimicrobiaceae bacterium]MCO5328906.1 MoxR family ATPase [Ilumatobacteraceae bacterium]